MATREWLGNAANTTDKWTITVGGTWASTETATVTMDGLIDLVVTVGTTTTTTAVAALIANAYNSAALAETDQAVSPAGGGQSIPQFYEATATVSGSVVTITARDAGKPLLAITASETSTSGTVTVAHPTTATGKHFFSNADNWSGNAVPVDGDDIVFARGNIDLKYDLAPAIQPGSVYKGLGYIGKIGLPEVNVDGGSSRAYKETRTTYLTFDNNATTCTYTIESGSNRVKIDAGAGQSVFNVLGSGTREDDTRVPATLLKGTHASNELNVVAGDVGVAFFRGETSTIATLRVGYSQNVTSDSTVYAGSGVTLTTVTLTGGTTTLNSATTTTTINNGSAIIDGTGAHTTLSVNGGDCAYNSTGTITTLNVGSRGKFDRSRQMRAATITNTVQMYLGAQFLDPHGALTLSGSPEIKLNRCRLADVTLEVGVDKGITVT